MKFVNFILWESFPEKALLEFFHENVHIFFEFVLVLQLFVVDIFVQPSFLNLS